MNFLLQRYTNLLIWHNHLDGMGDLMQPCLVFAVESWRESVIYGLLIAIEPLDFFFRQHFLDDRAGDDGTEGEVFEGVIWAERDALTFGISLEGCLDDQHGILGLTRKVL